MTEEETAKKEEERGGAAARPPTQSTLDQLEQLGELKSQGVLTDEEFAAQKAKVPAG